MLGWFRPRCPADPISKLWIEGRLRWLSEHFGEQFFLERPPVLPDRVHFPEIFEPRGLTLQALFERVCGYMDVDPGRVELEVMNEPKELGLINSAGHAIGGAAGYYRSDGVQERIQLSPAEFQAPIALIGTMAHELSHLKLLGDGRLGGEEPDNELTTDLCVVHHGLGIFLANSPRAWVSQCTRWPGTKVIKPEYMSAPLFGWALAQQAFLRGERSPGWFAHLTGDARATAKQGLAYVWKTKDTAFHSQDWSGWELLHGMLGPDA